MKTKFFLFYLLCFFTFSLNIATAIEDKKTVCLNMIIKDESQVIVRCLSSVAPLIDYWVIVDTGSTDNTQNIVKEYMETQGIPGELFERPWVNFAHNRNEALALAKGKADYVLIIDADEVLSFPKGYTFPPLSKDHYYIDTHYAGTTYARNQLIKNKLDWKWIGVVHEVLVSSQDQTSDTLPNIANVVSTDGARSKDPLKFHKDAQLLEGALKENPHDTRTVFYLAQSYRDAGELDQSIKNYQKRVDLGGWDQEVFWSLYQIASLQQAQNLPSDTIVKSYLNAYQYRPSRIEPLYRLAHYYRLNNNYLLSYLVTDYALKIPQSDDLLFLESWMTDYGLLLEYSIAAYWIGKYDDALKSSQKLLANAALPENARQCVEKNLVFIYAKLGVRVPEKIANTQ